MEVGGTHGRLVAGGGESRRRADADGEDTRANRGPDNENPALRAGCFVARHGEADGT